VEIADADSQSEIDEALRHWRQGDCVLGEHWFIFRIAPNAPLTNDATYAAEEELENAEASVFGLAVVSQTCDIVRQCDGRPFVEVCPLVEVNQNVLDEIERGRRPGYAYISGIADQGLVADLDRIMTAEKSVVAQWDRTRGCLNDHDARRLALALARKRARMAFPDDFSSLVAPLTRRMSAKHEKESDEGRALRALREIRIRAAPSWEADQIELVFWFIRDEDQPHFEQQDWVTFLEAWLSLIPANGRFGPVEGEVLTLDDLTARDYVESDILDLDHLSNRDD